MSQLYQVLEFERILNKLASYAQSDLAKEQCLQLQPGPNKDKVQYQLALLQQFIDYSYAFETLTFKGLYAHHEMFEKAKKDVYFSMFEVARTIENLKMAKEVTSKIIRDLKMSRFEHGLLLELTHKITTLDDLRKYLMSYFNEYELIKDDATEQLLRHNQEIKRIQTRIKDALNEYLTNHADLLSQNSIVMRNDRYVLPVKVVFKNRIKGIIHDQSVSGQTVFIEPREVVQLHLALQNEQFLKHEEIIKILKMLTFEIMKHHQALLQNEYVLTQLDFNFAKAYYAKSISANIVTFSDDMSFDLKQIWHPLLDIKSAIRNNFSLEGHHKTLLVSGSNTGGKTVLLKTMGIAALMAKCGLAVCAKEGGILPYYENIYADIGDEQSITNALSTFSSHITNIKYICDHASDNTLVLLDEIGAGTDPQEGSALAIAIIDYLAMRKATALVSTHFSSVKVFGFEKSYIKNASVLFDEVQLVPTYQWVYDEPGKSHALLIAQKLGLSQVIVKHATALLNESSQDVYAKMLALEEQITSAKKTETEYIEKNEQLFQSLAALEIKQAKIEKEKERILVEARKNANQLVEDTKLSLKTLFDENKSLMKQHEINNALSKAQALTSDLIEVKNNHTDTFSLNEQVLITTLNRVATIIQVNKNNYVVESDGKKINVKKEQLSKYTAIAPVKTKKTIKHKTTTQPKKDSQLEINLIGLRRDEALIQLDHFVSHALLNDLNTVRVIHGDGQGILRKAVHEYLKKNKHVKHFELASFYEGGTGATIVTF